MKIVASRDFDDRCLLGIPGRGLLGESKLRSVPSCLSDAPVGMSAPHVPSTVGFSTDDLPEKDRVAMWREHYGRAMLRVEIEPAEGGLFEACMILHILLGLHLLSSKLSAARITRTRELIADGNDDFVLVVNRTGDIAISARGCEVSLHEGDALVMSGDEVSVFERCSYGESFLLRIPRAILSSLVVDADGTIMRLIPRQSRPLKLLTSYMMALIDDHAPATAQLQHIVVSHVYDLAALTLSTTRDATGAKIRGITRRPAKSSQDLHYRE
jgi:hypothetical protein